MYKEPLYPEWTLRSASAQNWYTDWLHANSIGGDDQLEKANPQDSKIANYDFAIVNKSL